MPFDSTTPLALKIVPDYKKAYQILVDGGPGTCFFMTIPQGWARPDAPLRKTARQYGWKVSVKQTGDNVIFVHRYQ